MHTQEVRKTGGASAETFQPHLFKIFILIGYSVWQPGPGSSVPFVQSRNAGLEETQAGIKIAGGNINNLRYADDTTLMAESEEELKSLLVKLKEESEKVG